MQERDCSPAKTGRAAAFIHPTFSPWLLPEACNLSRETLRSSSPGQSAPRLSHGATSTSVATEREYLLSTPPPFTSCSTASRYTTVPTGTPPTERGTSERTSGEASSVTIFGTPIGGGPATTVGREQWSKDNGIQSWWWMHQNTVLLIVFGIFLASCVTAIMADRQWTDLASVTATGMADAGELGILAKDNLVITDASSASEPAPASSSTSDIGTSISESWTADSDYESSTQVEPIKTPSQSLGTSTTTTQRKWAEPAGELPWIVLHAGKTGVSRHAIPAHAPLWSEDEPHNRIRHPVDGRCGVVRFTFCPNLRNETYYEPQTSACVLVRASAEHAARKRVAAAAGGGHAEAAVCNSSPNRFTSFASCRKSCQRQDLPAERCFDKAIFSGCLREHVLSTRWFFDGRRCRLWTFPGGRCADGRAFRTHDQCSRTCTPSSLGSARKRQQELSCGPPAARSCSLRQLRFPYFADVSTIDGRIRCLEVSPKSLAAHRCLIGPNRFASVAQCRTTCLSASGVRHPAAYTSPARAPRIHGRKRARLAGNDRRPLMQ